jgi:hypothetical protein
MDACQNLDNLICRESVDENWVCTLCQEGPNPNDHLVMHTCATHIFHCSCLTLRMLTTPSCPVCLIDGNPNYSLVNNIRIGADFKCSKFCEICVSCRIEIRKYETYIQLFICKHRMHKSCTMEQILENGISRTGKINCPLCHF